MPDDGVSTDDVLSALAQALLIFMAENYPEDDQSEMFEAEMDHFEGSNARPITMQ